MHFPVLYNIYRRPRLPANFSSGDETTVSGISKVFGGTETADAVGHMIINAILALLWRWTLSLYASAATTTRLILIGAVVWCFGAELTQQFVPKRGPAAQDVFAQVRFRALA